MSAWGSPTIDTSVLAAALSRGALPLLQDLDTQTAGTQLWGAPVTLAPTTDNDANYEYLCNQMSVIPDLKYIYLYVVQSCNQYF